METYRKFEGAERVSDSFESVGDAVGEIVHGVDAPLVAGHLVRGLADPESRASPLVNERKMKTCGVGERTRVGGETG